MAKASWHEAYKKTREAHLQQKEKSRPEREKERSDHKKEKWTKKKKNLKGVNLLMAIRWVARAWNTVSPDTISKCFRKAGVLDSGMGVVNRGIEEEFDPFDDLDADHQVRDLISRTMPAEDSYTVEEYINGEDCVPVCSEFDKDNLNPENLNHNHNHNMNDPKNLNPDNLNHNHNHNHNQTASIQTT